MKKHEVYAILFFIAIILFFSVNVLFLIGSMYFRSGDSHTGITLYGIAGGLFVIAATCFGIVKGKD
jgi:hypothetical protein|nr:MAG TPA: hypothetical protein [Caudoviricetes sp.]